MILYIFFEFMNFEKEGRVPYSQFFSQWFFFKIWIFSLFFHEFLFYSFRRYEYLFGGGTLSTI